MEYCLIKDQAHNVITIPAKIFVSMGGHQLSWQIGRYELITSRFNVNYYLTRFKKSITNKNTSRGLKFYVYVQLCKLHMQPSKVHMKLCKFHIQLCKAHVYLCRVHVQLCNLNVQLCKFHIQLCKVQV